MTDATVRVYLKGTGKSDAVTAFAQVGNNAPARRLIIRAEDSIALQNGAGRFFSNVKRANSSEGGIAAVRPMLERVPVGAAAFDLSSARE